jgi:hypothetical protein
LKQTVLTNVAVLENKRIVQHGLHYGFAVKCWPAHTPGTERLSRRVDAGNDEDRRCREGRRHERHILDGYRSRLSSIGNELPAREVWRSDVCCAGGPSRGFEL